MTLIGAITYIGLCLIVGYIGREKKFGFIGNSLIALILSPVIGLIICLVQSDAKAPEAEKAI